MRLAQNGIFDSYSICVRVDLINLVVLELFIFPQNWLPVLCASVVYATIWQKIARLNDLIIQTIRKLCVHFFPLFLMYEWIFFPFKNRTYSYTKCIEGSKCEAK